MYERMYVCLLLKQRQNAQVTFYSFTVKKKETISGQCQRVDWIEMKWNEDGLWCVHEWNIKTQFRLDFSTQFPIEMKMKDKKQYKKKKQNEILFWFQFLKPATIFDFKHKKRKKNLKVFFRKVIVWSTYEWAIVWERFLKTQQFTGKVTNKKKPEHDIVFSLIFTSFTWQGIHHNSRYDCVFATLTSS